MGTYNREEIINIINRYPYTIVYPFVSDNVPATVELIDKLIEHDIIFYLLNNETNAIWVRYIKELQQFYDFNMCELDIIDNDISNFYALFPKSTQDIVEQLKKYSHVRFGIKDFGDYKITMNDIDTLIENKITFYVDVNEALNHRYINSDMVICFGDYRGEYSHLAVSYAVGLDSMKMYRELNEDEIKVIQQIELMSAI